MNITIIRYKVKSEAASEQEAAVKQLLVAIEADKPKGTRYASCKQSDGVSYVVLVQTEDGAQPLAEKTYLKDFQTELMKRLDGQPEQENLTVVASYNFFE